MSPCLLHLLMLRIDVIIRGCALLARRTRPVADTTWVVAVAAAAIV